MFNDFADAWLKGDATEYCRRHYLLTATSAGGVIPPSNDDPTPAQRLDYLSSTVRPSAMTHDWAGGDGVFATRTRTC